VIVNPVLGKYPHTLPTNVRRTLRTNHMITTSVLLDQDLAPRALLNVVITLSPTFQQPFPRFWIPMDLPLFTTEPFVFLPAGGADSHEARSAPENTVSGTRFEGVDFGTVGGGAISELIRVAAEIFEEGGFQ